jgi:hypothetical protein
MLNANLKRRMSMPNCTNPSPPKTANIAKNLHTIHEDDQLKSPIRKYITPKKQRTINGDRCKLSPFNKSVISSNSGSRNLLEAFQVLDTSENTPTKRKPQSVGDDDKGMY